MNIVSTSDLHGYFPTIEPCDLLLIAGDVCPIESKNRPLREHERNAQRHWICNEFREWCEDQPAKDIVWIAGNHDFGAESSFFESYAQGRFPSNIHYLKDESIELQGKTIYGCPWIPNLSNWAFYASDRGWKILSEDLPEADILVLHSPPSGLMLDGGHPDWASPYMLRAILDDVKPELCVFGHIHEGYGEIKIKGTTFANVAYCDEFYDPIQSPKVYEITEEGVTCIK